jgi:protein-S-isoprenylcysteine O-methyltransferase Ste14
MAIAFGLLRFLHDIRYHRERFRQFLGVAFVILVSAAGEPKKIWFVAGGVLVILGIAARLWSSGHIKKDKVLATDGPYAYVRHPLYVGNITLGFGFALASGVWWSVPLLVGLLVAFYPHAIRREDERLHRMFNKEWEQWRKGTRALIPRLTSYQSNQRGSWSFRQSLWQNGEPIIALFLLFWLYFLSLGLH